MRKHTVIYLLSSVLLLASCQDNFLSGQISISINDTKPEITQVKIQNDQLIVTGKNLDKVTVAKVEGSTNHTFEIESKTSSQIILNAKSAFSFLVGQTFNLIVSNAQAAATFPISFDLQNGQVTASKLHNMGASAGQVLQFNGTTWAPANAASSQVYAGTYNATTDTPDIVAAGGSVGTYYIVTTAGSQDLGTGSISFDVGDWVIYNGASWEKVAIGGNTVSNFNGRTGAVVPLANDYTWDMLAKTAGKLTGSSLSEIADVDVTGIQDGDILQWNVGNSAWEVAAVPAPTIAAGSISNTQLANSAVDSNKIVDGSIVNADISATADIAQSKILNLTTDLGNKEPLLPTGGTTAQYLRGNKTLATLDTAAVPENGNLYFTPARVLSTLITTYTTGGTGTIAVTDTIPQALSKLETKTNTLGNYVLRDGSAAMTDDLQMGGNQITGLGAPGIDTDAATKKYVDDAVAGVSGGGSSQWTTSGSDISYSLGKVGIGTASPGKLLHVAGDSNINSLLVGRGGGNVVTNTIAATNGLAANTSGANLTAVGYNVLQSNTLGSNNTGLGSLVLATNTTGNNNTAMGYNALTANTLGGLNTAIGTFSLAANLLGNNNTGVGYQSLYVNTNGVQNTALGSYTLASNTLGHNNTAVGYFALNLNTTGLENSAVGYYAQQGNTSGTKNVAIGSNALYTNTAGSGNVAVGGDALYDYNNTTNGLYTFNTVIGYNTGRGITTGINNTIIGSQVTGLSATLSNNIIIADGAGNRRINVDSTGNVGLGTTTIPERLTVNGNAAIQGDLQLKSDNANYVKLKAPASLASTLTFNLPGTYGTSNQVLTTDGAGNLSWTTASGGGGAPTGSAGGDLTGTYPNPTIAAGLDAAKIGAGSVSSAEFNYLDGVTSAIQTQLDGKEGSLPTGGTVAQYFRGNKTLSSFGDDVQTTLLTTLTGQTALPLASTDTLVEALGKLEAQITANDAAFDSTGQWGKATNDVYYTAGNVGVGLNNPSAKFHLRGPAAYESISADSAGPTFSFWKSRNYGATQAGDEFGFINFYGHDGTGLNRSAYILSRSEGSVAANSVPGNLSFHTTSVGATDSTEKMRISANGYVGIGVSSPQSRLHVASESLISHASNTSTGPQYLMAKMRGTSSSPTAVLTGDQLGTINFGGFYNTSSYNVEAASIQSLAAGNFSASSNPTALVFKTTPTGATSAQPRMTILDSGYVGIGHTNPTAALHVNGEVLSTSATATTVSAGVLYSNFLSASGDFPGNGVAVLRNTSSSGVSGTLFNDDGNTTRGFIGYVNSGAAGYPVNTLTLMGAGVPVVIAVDAAEKIGVTNTVTYFSTHVDIGTGNVLAFSGTPVCTAAGCTSSSDKRLKQNINPLVDSLNKILKLQGVGYDYIDTKKYGEQHQVGVIAQEVEKVFPEVVKTDAKTGLKSVAYDHLVAPIIEAIKELHSKVMALLSASDKHSREIASIKEENKQLKSENAVMKAYLCEKDPKASFCK